MKSLLSKLALQKAVGVCLGEQEISVSKVVLTPFGPIEVFSKTQRYSTEDLPEAIKSLLMPLVGAKKNVPVSVGLSVSRIFFGTRQIVGGGDTTAEDIMQKALRSPAISVDDLTVDMLVTTVERTSTASIVACRKKYISGIVEDLERNGIRPLRAEPASCALIRTAIAQRKYPRRAKKTLCVFLGATQGMAATVVAGMPLAWKTFGLMKGAESAAIISAVRTLLTQSANYGIDSSFDYIVIHGREDVHAQLKEEQLSTKLGNRVVWQPGPQMDGAAMAYGLAMGCLNPYAKAFDLSRKLKSRPAIWEIFPWWDLVYASLLVACMGIILYGHLSNVHKSHVSVRAQRDTHASLKGPEAAKLEKNAENISKRIEAVSMFLGSRILWSEYISDISAGLPPNVVVGAINGQWGMESGGGRMRKISKKSLIVNAVVPHEADGSLPRDIDKYIDGLRKNPLLKRDFGSVQLSGIERSKSRGKQGSFASFTIICSSGGKGKSGGKGSPPGKKTGK